MKITTKITTLDTANNVVFNPIDCISDNDVYLVAKLDIDYNTIIISSNTDYTIYQLMFFLRDIINDDNFYNDFIVEFKPLNKILKYDYALIIVD